MTRSHLTVFIAAALIVATAAPALAEILQNERRTLGRSEDAKQNDAAFDQQFRARGAGDTPEAKADPWAGVRQQPAPPPQPAATAKKNKI
jgi:hypothetical protein